jgi:large repetitive protein
VRSEIVKGLWPVAAALAALVLVASACELKPPTTSQSSPSSSPSQSPSPSPEPTPVAITSLSFHSGEVTVAYTPVVMAASGGTPPYQWTVGAGALPGGLTMSSDGSVSGTPSAAGSFTFTVHVADTGGRTAAVGASIPIVPAPSATLLPACAQYCAVEQGCDSTCGSFGSLAGGTAPFTFTLQGGYVPHGVSLLQLSLVGTFTSLAKFWQFTVLVTDAQGATSTISPTFYVYPHISLSSGTCVGDYNSGCTVSLPYSGGTPGAAPTVRVTGNGPPDTQGCWSSSGGPAPAGSTVTVGGGYVTVTIPKGIINGYGAVWTIVLTDQSTCAAGIYCSSPGATASIRVQCG